jgi:hypothetical protein
MLVWIKELPTGKQPNAAEIDETQASMGKQFKAAISGHATDSPLRLAAAAEEDAQMRDVAHGPRG